MKKFILTLMLVLTLTVSAYAANSEDVYLRRDVFEAKMDAFMAEIKLMNQNMRSELKQDINELSKAVSILSTRIDGLDARIDSTNTRIDDLRNGLYLWLVVIGTFIAFITLVISWPKAKDFLQNKKQFVSRDEIELIVERIVDAKIHSEKG